MSEEDFLAVSTMMDAKVKPVKSEIQRLRLEMENDYRPRLNTIEATYTGTFKRYESEIKNMEQMQLDIGVIKTLMTIHSEDIDSIKNTLKEYNKELDSIKNTLKEHDKEFVSIKNTLKEHDKEFVSIKNTLKEHDKRFDHIEDTLYMITDQIENLTGMVERLSS